MSKEIHSAADFEKEIIMGFTRIEGVLHAEQCALDQFARVTIC